MLSFFKKNKNKNLRGESYYDRENMIHNIGDLFSVFNPETTKYYTTNQNIKFNELKLSEIKEKDIIKMLKEPDFVIGEKDGLNGHKVLFYRHLVNNLIFLMQFHFLKGNFLFISNTTSSVTTISKEDKISFVNRIVKKYIPEINIDLKNGFEIKISDENNNFLNIIDGVNFKVNYINNSPYNQKLLKNPNLAKEMTEDNFDTKLDDYF
ncbi:MAG: hypothetical protein DRJ01_19310 [Bacteroidetes bacterium]|nr:MAG: hypothetical protein DRJ01_19310 [Bacteroidota bacterium]